MSHKTDHILPTDRRFGLLFGAVLAAIGTFGFWFSWPDALWVSLSSVGCLFILLGAALPKVLRPFNIAWYWLGVLLGKIVSPLVLGVLFFVLITPVAVIGRIAGRDELRLKPNSGPSHWIDRTPPGPSGASFTNQY